MQDNKFWYQSKTVWGALVAIAASLLNASGVGIDEGTEAQIVDGLVALSGAAGGLLAIYGRITANRKLG